VLSFALMASCDDIEVIDLLAKLDCLTGPFPQVRHGFITLTDRFRVHLDKFEDLFPGLAQLQGQFFKLVFIHSQLVSARFERCRAAKPVAGVFDFVGFHGRALRELFGYTVCEARNFREGEATGSNFSVAERLRGLGPFVGEGRSDTVNLSFRSLISKADLSAISVLTQLSTNTNVGFLSAAHA
jgi:hypothetical protein